MCGDDPHPLTAPCPNHEEELAVDQAHSSPSVFTIARCVMREDRPSVKKLNRIDEIDSVISDVPQAFALIPFKVQYNSIM